MGFSFYICNISHDDDKDEDNDCFSVDDDDNGTDFDHDDDHDDHNDDHDDDGDEDEDGHDDDRYDDDLTLLMGIGWNEFGWGEFAAT